MKLMGHQLAKIGLKWYKKTIMINNVWGWLNCLITRGKVSPKTAGCNPERLTILGYYASLSASSTGGNWNMLRWWRLKALMMIMMIIWWLYDDYDDDSQLVFFWLGAKWLDQLMRFYVDRLSSHFWRPWVMCWFKEPLVMVSSWWPPQWWLTWW